MCEILDEMRQEAYEDGRQQTMLENMRSIMRNLGVTAEKALDTIGVPKQEQGQYLAML